MASKLITERQFDIKIKWRKKEMYKQNREGWSKHFDFFFLDIILLEIAFFLSYGIRHDWIFFYNINYYRQIGIILALINVCMALFREVYHGVLKRDFVEEVKSVILHVSFVEVMLIAITFFMKELQYSREVFLLFWGMGVVFCLIGRSIWKAILHRRLFLNRGKRQILIVTTSNRAKGIITKLTSGEIFDYEIAGIVLTDKNYKGKMIESYPILGMIDEDAEYVHDYVVDEVFIHLNPGEFLEKKYIDSFVQTGKTVHFDLDGLAELDSPAYVEAFSGRKVITTSMKVVTPGKLFVKRVMDIAGGLIGIIITGIACLFVVPAIKIADPGPAFFSQERIGKNGRRFRIYKFRSMYLDAEERKKELMDQNEMQGLMFKMENDPRIIKGIGKFIRDTSIDELPQFWNVLKGDMSLVGTRPPTVEEYEMYEMHHLKRVSIKPGITGMWQTSGRNDITDFEEVVRLDTQYIVNWEISLDIKILLKTVLVVLKKEGSR